MKVLEDKNFDLAKFSLDYNDDAMTYFEDKGYCLYPYISENAEFYDIVLDNHFGLPIIVCNLNHFKGLVVKLEKGMNSLVEQTKEYLKMRPELIPFECLFNNKLVDFNYKYTYRSDF